MFADQMSFLMFTKCQSIFTMIHKKHATFIFIYFFTLFFNLANMDQL